MWCCQKSKYKHPVNPQFSQFSCSHICGRDKLEKMSASEGLLYKEENILGKGIGCVAVKSIKKGTLLVREHPQLFLSDKEILEDPNIPILQEFLQIAEGVIMGFLEMSREDQENYMKLHNNYASDNWSQRMAASYRSVMQATDQMTFPNISKEKAFKVWASKFELHP